MFDTYVARRPSRRPWTFTASLVCQVLLIASLAAIPLITTPELAGALRAAILLAPPPPPSPSPPPEPTSVPFREDRFELYAELKAPADMPDRAALLIDDVDKPPPVERSSGLETRRTSAGRAFGPGVPGGLFRPQVPAIAPPPKPAEPTSAELEEREPLLVGGNVQAAKLLRRTEPIYPQLARQARVSGTVRLKAIISKDGTIKQLSVVSGHPLLVGEALRAVQQWRYRPTELNGSPVEVTTVIAVRFRLR